MKRKLGRSERTSEVGLDEAQFAVALRETTIFVSSVFTHMDLEGDNIVFARVGPVKSPSNRVGTRRPSTHLCKVLFWRWCFQATDIARR